MSDLIFKTSREYGADGVGEIMVISAITNGKWYQIEVPVGEEAIGRRKLKEYIASFETFHAADGRVVQEIPGRLGAVLA